MKRNLLLFLIALSFSFLSFLVVLAADPGAPGVPGYEEPGTQPVCGGTYLSAPFTGTHCVKDFGEYVITILDWAMLVIGPLALLMLIVGGWQYMMAAGNPDAISGAQRTITRALTGLIAMFAMWGLMELLWPK